MTDKGTPRVVKSHDVYLDSEYVQWIYDVKQRFRNAQIKAAVKVNAEQLYFNGSSEGILSYARLRKPGEAGS